MKFLAGEIWTRLSTLMGAHEVILLLLCGNKALSAQLLERVTHLKFRYEPQSKFEFPGRLPPFKRLISVSVGRAHSGMPIIAIDGLDYSNLPANLEELNVESIYHLPGFDQYETGNIAIHLTALRRLTLASSTKINRAHGITNCYRVVYLPDFSDLPNLTFLDLSRTNNGFFPHTVRAFPRCLLELRIGTFVQTEEFHTALQDAKLDSSTSPALSIFPPHLHTLYMTSNTVSDFKLLPHSLTDLRIQMRDSGQHEAENYPFLGKLQRLTRLDFTGYTAVESFLQNIPPSVTHLWLNCDVHNVAYWSLIWSRLEELKTLRLMEGQMLRMFQGPASVLPRSLTSISTTLFDAISAEEVEFLPPHLTGFIDDPLCVSNESDWISSLPRTCAFTYIALQDPTSDTLLKLPPPSQFSVKELDVQMSKDEESTGMGKFLGEISTYFRQVEHLTLVSDFPLPLASLSSFTTPLRSLSITRSDCADASFFDTNGLNFGCSALRHLTSLSLPFCCSGNIKSPVTWFATLPRNLETFIFGLEDEIKTVRWDSSVFAVLPRSLTSLVLPITPIDGSRFEDLPPSLTKLVINGEVSTFDFEVLNKLPRPLSHISFPMHALAESDGRRSWELELKKVFLQKRRGLSFFSLGHPLQTPVTDEYEEGFHPGDRY